MDPSWKWMTFCGWFQLHRLDPSGPKPPLQTPLPTGAAWPFLEVIREMGGGKWWNEIPANFMVVYDSSNSLTNHWVEETEVAGPDGNNGDENSDYEPIVLHPHQGTLNTGHLEILRFWCYKYWGEVDL